MQVNILSKYLVLAIATILLGFAQSSFGKSPSEEIISAEATVAILKEWETLKPGASTRSDLLKIFGVTGGGIGDASMRTYGYRDCPHILVDVTFTISWSNQADDKRRPASAKLREQWDGRPTDKISTISKPYLGFLALD